LLDSALKQAQHTETRRDLLRQEHYLLHVLHVVGPDANLYALLARIAREKGESKQAAYFARRSLAIDPANRTAREVFDDPAGAGD